MYLIGLTGGIGSGKSTVSNMLKSNGEHIIDADKIAREITKDGAAAVSQLARIFGNEILIKEGVLDRKKLADIVFSDPDKKKELDTFMMIRIVSDINIELERLSKERRVFLDAPLLFESGLDSICDEIWSVFTDMDTRIERIIERDGIKKNQVTDRIKSQMPDEDKVAKSQVTIDNNGSIENLRETVMMQLKNLDERIDAYEEEDEDDINNRISGDPFLDLL